MPAKAKKKPVRAIRHRHVRPAKPPTRELARKEALPPLSLPERVEQVLIAGDLSPLTPQERVEYYHKVCQSLGLNWLTQPFNYILFRESDNAPAKLQLYANKDCAAQLRKLHRVSIIPPLRKSLDADRSIYSVEADLRDGYGKTDTATGIVPLWKWKDGKRQELIGRELANALMKTETKAKRRGTLSICGLAFLDESELDTMQILGGVTREGRIFQYKTPLLPDGHEPELLESSARTEAEKNWDAREAAGIEKLTPAQKEVVRKKMAEHDAKKAPIMETEYVDPAKSRCAECGSSFGVHLVKCSKFLSQTGRDRAADSLHYELTPSGSYFIDGPDAAKKANRDILAPLYVHPTGIMATPQQLGKLISEFERRKVAFRDVTPREAGE
jgi:hypothetical protein